MARLTREARQILAEMELLSYGKVASWNSSGGKGENENPVPQGDSNPLHEFWRREFAAAGGYEELMCCVGAAQIELDAIRRRDPDTPVPEEGRDAWEERLIDEGEGHEAKVVATSFGTSVAVVTKLRKKYDRDPNLGLHLAMMPGETVRQMAARTGMSKSAIGRLSQVSG
jgi:hypothetical protein